MKICILSDSHDNLALLEHAVADARARGAEAVLHCGDVVAPSTLKVVQKRGLPVHVIHGNNTGDLLAMTRMAARPDSLIHYYGQDAGISLGGRNIFLVHYPHYAAAMALTGDWDLVCCGHEHRPEVRTVSNIKGGRTWLVNPGTVGGVGAPATWVLGDLESLVFEVIDVVAGRYREPPDLDSI
jgi:putative phosphoesterase